MSAGRARTGSADRRKKPRRSRGEKAERSRQRRAPQTHGRTLSNQAAQKLHRRPTSSPDSRDTARSRSPDGTAASEASNALESASTTPAESASRPVRASTSVTDAASASKTAPESSSSSRGDRESAAATQEAEEASEDEQPTREPSRKNSIGGTNPEPSEDEAAEKSDERRSDRHRSGVRVAVGGGSRKGRDATVAESGVTAGGAESAPGTDLPPIATARPAPATTARPLRLSGNPEESQTRAHPPPTVAIPPERPVGLSIDGAVQAMPLARTVATQSPGPSAEQQDTGRGGWTAASTPAALFSSGDTRSPWPRSPNPDATASLDIQAKLTVGGVGDRYEREADAVASAVTAGRPAPAVSTLSVGRRGGLSHYRQPRSSASARQADGTRGSSGRASRPAVRRVTGTGSLQRSQPPSATGPRRPGARRPPRVPVATAATIRNPGTGRSVPDGIRRAIEPRLGTSLDGVQVHAGPKATEAAGTLGARAFTHRNHIFLGRGESASDVRLMAHEATHVVQQRAAPAAVPTVQRWPDLSLDDLPGIDAAEIARRVPGFTLFTVILGYNPITNAPVEFTGPNLLQGLFELVPFGADIYDALADRGIVQDAFAWVQENIPNVSTERIVGLLETAWDKMGITLSPSENIDILISTFRPLYDELASFASAAVDKVLELIKEAAIDAAESLLEENRAWGLIKKVLGRDPLRDEEVEATPEEILTDFLLLIDQEQHLAEMRKRETLEETAQWLATQLETFRRLLGQLRGLIERTWEALQPANLGSLATNIERLGEEVGTFLQDVWTFAWTVAAEVLARIKDALLGWLSDYAHDVPGFHLLTVILERDPFTEEPVARTAENLIRGFITLLPGGAAIYQQLAETGVIGQAAGRIEGAVERLGITWDLIVGLFTGIWEHLSIEALVEPIDTFASIVARFGEPLSRLFAFVNVVLRELFGALLQLMNFPSDLVASIISNAMQAIADIRTDPIGFLRNMLAAVKLGFENFFGNILSHLAGGLADWLFRGLRTAGLEPPIDLSLQSVLEFVLQVLGISADRIWERLAERIGQENVDRIRGAIDRLTGIWEFVTDVRERGITAIWEYIESQITGLWDMVLEKAQEWIMERVIDRAMRWLVSLLDPTGIMAVINSFQAFFNAIQSAMEYLRDILAIVNDYVSTITAVARGSLAAGAAKLEQGLASAIPVALGFLANQLGLGNIGEKIVEIVAGIRSVIDRALDWLLDRAVSAVESGLELLGIGGAERTPQPDHGDDEIDASDHSAVVRSVIQELEGLDATDDYPSARAAVEARAEALENYWSSRLESGLGLAITLTPVGEDRSDADIDFVVLIAPNNTEGTGTVAVEEETSASAFVGQRVPAVEQDLVEAGYVRPYQLESGTWVIRVPPGNPENLPRLTTEADGITITLASSRRESSPAGEVYFDPADYVPPPASVRELFKPRVFEGEYVLMRSRYSAGLPRTSPDSAEARQEVESLITGEPARERRSLEEVAADEILMNAGFIVDPSTSEDIYERGERLTLEASTTGEMVPTRDAVTIASVTAMSPGLTEEFLDAWFANGGWPPHWQVDHAQEVRFGGADTISNYAPLPLHDHQKKSKWAGDLAKAVLEDPEIRAAFHELETAEARGLNFEP